jgi:LuxR family maltose regulon positive regulatory protein
MSFEEMRERLHGSRHTVKTQAVWIYGKLGVSSRSEAVNQSIEIGLLEPFLGLRLTASASGD